jgi:aspartokinase/homoserine dehydrogenase 1
MQVLKFGGTSVANAENINKVVAIVKESLLKDKTVVVVSALGGVTDLLLNAAQLAAEGAKATGYGQAIDTGVAAKPVIEPGQKIS